MIEAPAAEIIFKIYQLLGKLIKRPVLLRILINLNPSRHDGIVS
jgi:hypothetical protein